MMGSGITQPLVTLFWATIGIGALVMFLRHPSKANALLSAGPATVVGVIHGLESGNLNSNNG